MHLINENIVIYISLFISIDKQLSKKRKYDNILKFYFKK